MRGAHRAADAGAKPALFPGRGVARVRLGQPRDARRLGRPLIKSPRANRSATANDCRVLDPRCRMVPGRGGTWVYDDLNVVFGADRRVSALIYSGRGRSAKGVGVGSSLRAVRAAYPGASCVTYPRQTNCALKSTYRSRAVNTVFHFIKSEGPTQVRSGADVLRRRAARGDGRMSSEVATQGDRSPGVAGGAGRRRARRRIGGQRGPGPDAEPGDRRRH